MRFGEHQRFEAKVLVDDKDVREYVDADDNTLVRVSVQCFQPSGVPRDALLGTPCSLQLSGSRILRARARLPNLATRDRRRTRPLSTLASAR